MEKFNLNDYDAINNNNSAGLGVSMNTTNYYKDNKTIAFHTFCQCKRNYYQLWKPATFKCFSCEEIEKLKKEKYEQASEITKLREEVGLAKVNQTKLSVGNEDFIDKSENWHREQLIQKEEEVVHLRNKLQSLEEKFNQLETKYSELIIKEN